MRDKIGRKLTGDAVDAGIAVGAAVAAGAGVCVSMLYDPVEGVGAAGVTLKYWDGEGSGEAWLKGVS